MLLSLLLLFATDGSLGESSTGVASIGLYIAPVVATPFIDPKTGKPVVANNYPEPMESVWIDGKLILRPKL